MEIKKVRGSEPVRYEKLRGGTFINVLAKEVQIEDGTQWEYWQTFTKELNTSRLDSLYKEVCLSVANMEYEDAVKELVGETPTSEIQTWAKQEQEARAWLADSNTPTPFIDILSTARGVDKAYLVNKVVEKADIYANAVGVLTGIRQKIEDEI